MCDVLALAAVMVVYMSRLTAPPCPDRWRSLTIVYGVFAIVNLVAPYIISRIGIRSSMIMGGLFYCTPLVAMIHVVPAVYLCASALNGIGAACLWCAQGAAITNCSDDKVCHRLQSRLFFWGGRGAGGRNRHKSRESGDISLP